MVYSYLVNEPAITMAYGLLSATNDTPIDAACAVLEGYVAKIQLTEQVCCRVSIPLAVRCSPPCLPSMH